MFKLFLAAVYTFQLLTQTVTGSLGNNTLTLSSSASMVAAQIIIFPDCPGTYTITSILGLSVLVTPSLQCALTNSPVSVGIPMIKNQMFLGSS